MLIVADRDHTERSCFVCIVFTYSDNFTIMGTDGILSIDNVMAPFKADVCKTLAGKPKFFIFQVQQKLIFMNMRNCVLFLILNTPTFSFIQMYNKFHEISRLHEKNRLRIGL